ncbi:unnamed protein product [Phytophthora fragariaefolia]|uniref:Unnamed protein product n=1 Tax=Phytophthora fragariaefolia TaxID=1490495 RepID=A0A9W6U6U4_9STRA|nr:unnamed protein product [Phytophthora fragariaefolia]
MLHLTSIDSSDTETSRWKYYATGAMGILQSRLHSSGITRCGCIFPAFNDSKRSVYHLFVDELSLPKRSNDGFNTPDQGHSPRAGGLSGLTNSKTTQRQRRICTRLPTAGSHNGSGTAAE